MALKARVINTFPRGERTPDFIQWEGNVIVVKDGVIDPRTERDEMVLMGQMSLVRGKDGGEDYLSFPGRKASSGKFYANYKVGPSLSNLIIPVIREAMNERESEGNVVSAAQDTFGDLDF